MDDDDRRRLLTSSRDSCYYVTEHRFVDGHAQIGQHLAQVAQINHSVAVCVHQRERVVNLLAGYLLRKFLDS